MVTTAPAQDVMEFLIRDETKLVVATAFAVLSSVYVILIGMETTVISIAGLFFVECYLNIIFVSLLLSLHSNTYTCTGHGICNPQAQAICDCNSGWSGFGKSGVYCTVHDSINETNNGSKVGDTSSSKLWLALIISLPSAAGLGLLLVWYLKFRPTHQRMLAFKALLMQPGVQSNRKKSAEFKSNLSLNNETFLMVGDAQHEVPLLPFVCKIKELLL